MMVVVDSVGAALVRRRVTRVQTNVSVLTNAPWEMESALEEKAIVDVCSTPLAVVCGRQEHAKTPVRMMGYVVIVGARSVVAMAVVGHVGLVRVRQLVCRGSANVHMNATASELFAVVPKVMESTKNVSLTPVVVVIGRRSLALVDVPV